VSEQDVVDVESSSQSVSQSSSPVHGRAEKLQSDEPRDCSEWVGGRSRLLLWPSLGAGLGFVGIAWTCRERALTRPIEELPIRPLLLPQREEVENTQ
jgi:hypothetical protein